MRYSTFLSAPLLLMAATLANGYDKSAYFMLFLSQPGGMYDGVALHSCEVDDGAISLCPTWSRWRNWSDSDRLFGFNSSEAHGFIGGVLTRYRSQLSAGYQGSLALISGASSDDNLRMAGFRKADYRGMWERFEFDAHEKLRLPQANIDSLGIDGNHWYICRSWYEPGGEDSERLSFYEGRGEPDNSSCRSVNVTRKWKDGI